MSETHDVIVVGGGFAGVTAARECAVRGRETLLLEARERLGGRTWSADWHGVPIEYGGAWVHWHQPHTFSELTRAGLSVSVGDDAEAAGWHVGGERREGRLAQRDTIARRGWDRFVDGVVVALPQPHAPLSARPYLARFDRLSIADRLAQLSLSLQEHDVLVAELESLAHAPLTDAGAVSVLRWHALSGYSLKLTQFTGGRVTIDGGTGALLAAIRDAAPCALRLETPVATIVRRDDGVEVVTRAGESHHARVVIVAVALNVLGAIAFDPPLPPDKRAAIASGQASRGIKLMLLARGPATLQNSIRPGHPFGYLASERRLLDGTQLMIGFGPDATRCDATDLASLQRQLDAILPGYELLDATAHDWLADEFSRGTWAIHRPGWYEHHHAAMRRAEGRVLLAGSDLANGWAGFIDGAIESGLTFGAAPAALSRSG
ncbi:MAG: flavin monoamine oxidase family protein [Solirubrobacteraceae bacterium]